MRSTCIGIIVFFSCISMVCCAMDRGNDPCDGITFSRIDNRWSYQTARAILMSKNNQQLAKFAYLIPHSMPRNEVLPIIISEISSPKNQSGEYIHEYRAYEYMRWVTEHALTYLLSLNEHSAHMRKDPADVIACLAFRTIFVKCCPDHEARFMLYFAKTENDLQILLENHKIRQNIYELTHVQPKKKPFRL